MRISDWSSDVCSSDLTLANTVFRADVRFFGAGVIAVAAIWTLVKIAGPVLGGIRSAMAASRARQGGQALAIEEQDMSITWVFGGSLFLMLPIGALLWLDRKSTRLNSSH